MLSLVGRGLQLIGMVLLPIGLVYGLVLDEIRTEVWLLAAGGLAFVTGWLLTKRERD